MNRLMIWYGRLTTRRALTLVGSGVLSAPVLWLAGFLLLPSLALVALAFARPGLYGGVIWDFSLDNFKRLASVDWTESADVGQATWSAPYLLILGRSVWVALVTTFFSLVLAYPLAFFIAARPRRTRYLWLAVVVLPLCTNMVIRTYAWTLILGFNSPLVWLVRRLGLIGPLDALYPGATAVYAGMLSCFLPFAVLPLYASVERLDYSLVDAACDLYASRRRVFMQAILPQTLPGLVVATILTFIPAMGVFVVPDLLGGARTMLVGNLIQQQFGPSRDWPFGAAVSLSLVVLTLAGLLVLRRWRREGDFT